MDKKKFVNNFWSSVGARPAAASLFDYTSDLYYFAKNISHQFVRVNKNMVVKLMGFENEEECIGLTDLDIWPKFLSQKYIDDDKLVFRSAKPVANRIELILREDKTIDWFYTTKIPLFDFEGNVIGVEGFSRYVKKANSDMDPIMKMPEVMDYIMNNYFNPIEVKTLAQKMNLSVKQFERNFKKIYGTTPIKYITKIRIDVACQMLAQNQISISEIALQTGFYDASHFSNQFQKTIGQSPKSYREKFKNV